MFFDKLINRVLNVLGRDLVVSFLYFFTTVFLAAELGVDNFGVWMAVVTFLATCDLALRLKIDQLIVFYANEFDSSYQVIKKISLLTLYPLIAGIVIILVASDLVLDFFGFLDINFLLLAYLAFVLSVCANLTYYILLSESQFSEYNICVLIQSFSFSASVVFIFTFFNASVFAALIAQNLSWVFVLVYFVVSRIKYLRRREDIKEQIEISNREILARGLSVYASSAVKGIQDQLPRYYALAILGSTYVGQLGVAQTLITLCIRVPTAINTVLYPMLVNEEVDELESTLSTIRILLILFLPIVFFLLICIDFVVDILFGDEFAEAARFIRMLLPFVYIGIPGLVLTPYFSSIGKFNILAMSSVCSILVSVVVLLVFHQIAMEYAPIMALNAAFVTTTIVNCSFALKSKGYTTCFPTMSDCKQVIHFLRRRIGVRNER